MGLVATIPAGKEMICRDMVSLAFKRNYDAAYEPWRLWTEQAGTVRKAVKPLEDATKNKRTNERRADSGGRRVKSCWGTVAGSTQHIDIDHGHKNLEIGTVNQKNSKQTSCATADRGQQTDTRNLCLFIPVRFPFMPMNNWMSPARQPLPEEVIGSSTGSHWDHISEVPSSGEQRPGK